MRTRHFDENQGFRALDPSADDAQWLEVDMARDFAVAAVLVHLRYTHASYRGRFKNIVARYMEH